MNAYAIAGAAGTVRGAIPCLICGPLCKCPRGMTVVDRRTDAERKAAEKAAKGRKP